MIQIDFKKNNGLVPVIVQDVHTNQVLMLAYMNEESLRLSIETKLATYYSRSKISWIKRRNKWSLSTHSRYFSRLR